MAYLKEFQLHTVKNGFYNISRDVAAFVAQSGVSEGACIIFSPHTTAGITLNENADPDVVFDMTYTLNKVFPKLLEYRHMEGNSDAHVKSTLAGAQELIIIHNGKLLLGTWQGIYFCEFDGPRSRRYFVKITED